VSRTPKNTNHSFYVCIEKGVRIGAISQFPWSLSNTALDLLAFMLVKCFFLWVDALAHALMNELQEEHEEWLPILSRTAAVATRAPEEEIEGGARIDREVAVELRRLNEKIRKLEDQAQVSTMCNGNWSLCNYIWAFVGLVVALFVMLQLYGKA